jgi:hypothetical protein
MLWEREAASLDFFIGGLDFGSFKGRFTDELGVTEYSTGYMMTPTDQTSTS